jgi:response regulator of citrate/malate metabolism
VSSVVLTRVLTVKSSIRAKRDWTKFEQRILILLDLAMPDFSGLDVIKSLNNDGLVQSRNIVIFTASSNQDILQQMKNYGIKEIFKKPFSLDDLTNLIERYRPREN